MVWLKASAPAKGMTNLFMGLAAVTLAAGIGLVINTAINGKEKTDSSFSLIDFGSLIEVDVELSLF